MEPATRCNDEVRHVDEFVGAEQDYGSHLKFGLIGYQVCAIRIEVSEHNRGSQEIHGSPVRFSKFALCNEDVPVEVEGFENNRQLAQTV